MKILVAILFFATSLSAQYVLEFDGTKAHHVDHGAFFVDTTQLKNSPIINDLFNSSSRMRKHKLQASGGNIGVPLYPSGSSVSNNEPTPPLTNLWMW